jgi:leader peptidase (prepilin peptidase)/N-methyltransferase
MVSVIATWIGLSFELRLMILAILGLIGGALANHIIYTFAYFNPRPISAWGRPSAEAPPRKITDRIPLIGWIGLSRESSIHGFGFWIRPFLIELSTAILFMWLCWFETRFGGLLPGTLREAGFLAPYENIATQIFFAHAILSVFLIAATFIDFDELTIPDVITIPGTIIALILGALTINHLMPTALPIGPQPPDVKPTAFDSPWFTSADTWTSSKGLATGLAIWTIWCFALADRRWSGVIARRRGLGRAIRHFINGLFHYGFWKLLVAIWVAGSIGILSVWRAGGTHWYGLFTALVGLAVGGGVIWAIRIVATLALDREAMGFGDVTLMAMIGAFVGWQASVIAFFLSPFTAIFIVLARYAITRDAYTPYGPYLCAGTALTIVYWDRLYNGWLATNLNLMGDMLLWFCLGMLGLMAVMLFVWRLIKNAIG